MMTSCNYWLFGLRVRSDLPLPEVRRVTDQCADVSIRYGRLPAAGGAGAPVRLEVDERGALLHVDGVARYRIARGSEIIVDPQPDSSERNRRLFLLGSAFGILLHQRGILPLHANAIDLGGRAVAFMGHSGAGKSTLAAALARRGHAILSDDVCAIDWGPDGVARALPGVGRLRLWRDTLEHRGECFAGYERAFDEVEKYTVPVAEQMAGSAVPLAAIHLLRVGEPAGVRRLGGAEASAALIANTYRGAYVAPLAAAERHFRDCLRLARAVPLFEFRRPWDLDQLDSPLDRLLAEPSAVAAG